MRLVDLLPQRFETAMLVRLAAYWAALWALVAVGFWASVALREDDAFRWVALALALLAAASSGLHAWLALRAYDIQAAGSARTFALAAVAAFLSHGLLWTVVSPLMFGPAAAVLAWRAARTAHAVHG